MKILIFNWRDTKNSSSGGAEILTHELARRWVKEGHEVVQFSSFFEGAKTFEEIDGVKIIRGGTANFRQIGIPVHIAAFLWYIKEGRGKFDVVLDEIHGIPFFTPLYVKEKKVVLICEIANEIWDVIFTFPFNVLGKFIERNYFRFYKTIPFLTISSSTKIDLISMGIRERNITVLPMGISLPKKLGEYKKEEETTLIFVGRISKTKGIEDVLFAFKDIRNLKLKARLWIIGRGDYAYEQYIKQLCKSLDIQTATTFFGYVSDEKKFELMSKAHILLAPSLKEGWGLIVMEAGICGTPSVVYDTAGLRDIVEDGITGIIVERSHRCIAEGVISLLSDKSLYKRMQIAAKRQAKKKNWDSTAKSGLTVLSSNLI